MKKDLRTATRKGFSGQTFVRRSPDRMSSTGMHSPKPALLREIHMKTSLARTPPRQRWNLHLGVIAAIMRSAVLHAPSRSVRLITVQTLLASQRSPAGARFLISGDWSSTPMFLCPMSCTRRIERNLSQSMPTPQPTFRSVRKREIQTKFRTRSRRSRPYDKEVASLKGRTSTPSSRRSMFP